MKSWSIAGVALLFFAVGALQSITIIPESHLITGLLLVSVVSSL